MPTGANVYTDKLLTGVVAQPHQQQNFIAEELLPSVNAMKQSGPIARIDKDGEMIRETDDRVSKLGLPLLVDHDVDTEETYFAVKHQLMGGVPDEDAANMDSEFAAHSDKVAELDGRIQLNKERRLIRTLDANMTTSDYLMTLDGTTGKKYFDDYDDGDPLSVLEGILTTVESRSGLTPTDIGMGSKVARRLALHPDIRGVGSGVIRPEEEVGNLENMRQRIGAILGVNVHIARSIYNSAAMGATKSVSQIWGRRIIILVKQPISLATTYAGFGFHVKWNTGNIAGNMGGLINGKRVQRWRDDVRDAEMFKLTEFYDQKTMNKASGFMIANAVSS